MSHKPPKTHVDKRGRLYVDKMINGKKYRKYFGKAGTREAKANHAQFLQDCKNGTVNWAGSSDGQPAAKRPRKSTIPSLQDFTKSTGGTKLATAVRDYLREIQLKDLTDSTMWHYAHSLGELVRLFGDQPVDLVRSRAVKTYRIHLATERGWGFTQINRADGIVRRFIRWAVEMEYASPEVKWIVCDMKRIEPGDLGAARPVTKDPVGFATLQATLPFLDKTIGEMLLVQFFCGMRPQDVRRMRGRQAKGLRKYGTQRDLVWLLHREPGQPDVVMYRLDDHKMRKKTDQALVKAVPDRALEILARHLDREDQEGDGTGYLFRPSVARAERFATLPDPDGNRTTPRYPSEVKRVAEKKAETASKVDPANDCYSRSGFENAVKRGVRAAVAAGMIEEPWSANQLRHGVGTYLAQVDGVDSAGRYLGHSATDENWTVTRKHYAPVSEPELARVARVIDEAASRWLD